MIRLGLIGCGAWGWRYIPAALEAGNCTITHVARAAHPMACLAGVRVMSSWREMMHEPIDAFVVATPPSTHEEICTELLEACRPVMVEKPVALSHRAAMRIARASHRAYTPHLINHLHLFAPAYEALRARASDWEHASIVSIGCGLGPVRDYSALWDYGPHDVAMFLGLVRDGETAEVVDAHRDDGMHRMHLRSGSRSAHVTVANDRQKQRVVRVANGRGDVMIYDDMAPLGAKLLLNGWPVDVDDGRPLTRSVRAFAAAVSGGETDWRFDPNLGIEVSMVLERADALAS